MKNNGVRAEMLDAEVLSLGICDIVDIAKQKKPKIIGFNCHTLNRHVVYEIVKTLRIVFSKDIFIILGGPHPTLSPKDTLVECPEIDAIVVGEGERTLYEIYQGIKKIEKIHGIAFIKNGKFNQSPPRARIEDLDELPFPNLEDVPFEEYTQYEDLELPGLWKRTYLSASRGCNYGCSFCADSPHWQGKTTYRSSESIIAEIVQYQKKSNIHRFYFYDDTLTDWPQLKSFCEACSHLNISWSCSTRIDHMSDSIIKMMSQAGCEEIGFGLETSSKNILNRIGKEWQHVYSHKEVGMIIRNCVEHGITPRTHFMIGFPWENQNDIVNTVKFAVYLKEFSLSDVNFFVVKIYPGTHLYRDVIKNSKNRPFDIINRIYNSWSVFDWFDTKNKKVAAKLMRFNDIPEISPHPFLDSLELRRVTRNAYEIFFSNSDEQKVEEYLWNGICGNADFINSA